MLYNVRKYVSGISVGDDWIRYEGLPDDSELHFQFEDGKLWAVTAMWKNWRS